MEQLPQPGAVVATKADQAFKSTKWELSNGISVYLLPTDYADNEINIRAVSPGGLVREDPKDINVRATNDFAEVGGYGGHTPNEIEKILTGRKVSVSASIGRTSETISGYAAKSDAEQLFQAIHLMTTDLRKDTALFSAARDRQVAMLEAAMSNPTKTILRDSLPSMIYGGNPEALPLTIDQIKSLDYDKILETYKSRFSDMGDFTFFIVGDFELDSIKPLVERYIATLPNTARGETWQRELALPMAKKSSDHHFTYEVSTPSVFVIDMLIKDNATYDLKNILMAEILSSILDQQYLVSIREEEGGTYGVSAMGSEDEFPTPTSQMMIVFQTNKEQAEHLNQRVKDEMKEMVEKGLNKEFFEKAVLNMKKQFDENQHKNSYWMDQLEMQVLRDRNTNDKLLETLDSITIEDVRQYLKNIMTDNTYLEMIAIGEPAAKEAAAKPAA